MRKFGFILILSLLAVVAGGLAIFALDLWPKPLTIAVDGETIVLEPGVNVRPEIYEAARDPAFRTQNDWVFIDGYWDVMPEGVSVPLELGQIILLEDHPGFPEGFEWTVANGYEVPTFPGIQGEQVTGKIPAPDGRMFDYSLILPVEWAGKYVLRQEGDVLYFDYQGDPALAHPLFSVAALTEAQWQQAQTEVGHGTGLISVDGIVFVYGHALDNPYSGAHGDAFQRMAAQLIEIVSTWVATPSSSADTAWLTYDFSNGIRLNYPPGWTVEPIQSRGDGEEAVFVGEGGEERIMVSLNRRTPGEVQQLNPLQREPNEAGYVALWPSTARLGNFEWTDYVWGQLLDRTLDGAPQLTAEAYSPVHGWHIAVSTSVPLELEKEFNVKSMDEVLATHFATFRRMLESIRFAR